MIYTGLELGAFFEIPFSSACHEILRGVNPLLQMIFTFMQMYFIFMNARVSLISQSRTTPSSATTNTMHPSSSQPPPFLPHSTTTTAQHPPLQSARPLRPDAHRGNERVCLDPNTRPGGTEGDHPVPLQPGRLHRGRNHSR